MSQRGRYTVEQIEKLCPYTMTETEKYKLRFIIRAAVSTLDVDHILAPALEQRSAQMLRTLPDGFVLQNGKINRKLEAFLVKRGVCTI